MVQGSEDLLLESGSHDQDHMLKKHQKTSSLESKG